MKYKVLQKFLDYTSPYILNPKYEYMELKVSYLQYQLLCDKYGPLEVELGYELFSRDGWKVYESVTSVTSEGLFYIKRFRRVL